MRQQPSDMFVTAIVDGYLAERERHEQVTPSAIWDHICMRCMRMPNGFLRMFSWDTRKASQNRIRTIMEVIEAGMVPGLSLMRTPKGKAIVVREP